MSKANPMTQEQGLLRLTLKAALKNFLFRWSNRITRAQVRKVLLMIAKEYEEVENAIQKGK